MGSDERVARLRKAPPGLPVFPLCAFVSFVVKLSARCVRRARTVRARRLARRVRNNEG
jgi:hypothetical protein